MGAKQKRQLDRLKRALEHLRASAATAWEMLSARAGDLKAANARLTNLANLRADAEKLAITRGMELERLRGELENIKRRTVFAELDCLPAMQLKGQAVRQHQMRVTVFITDNEIKLTRPGEPLEHFAKDLELAMKATIGTLLQTPAWKLEEKRQEAERAPR